jgi:diguanylate cyclase (GGDEF)-like protein/PAS domain S-box-containing protein
MEDREGHEPEGGTVTARMDEWLLAPAPMLEGLPDAVVASGADERIVFVNVLAEELFGYSRAELIGRPVEMLWPERFRARYTRNMRLYFATEEPLRFTTEAWGLRRDGSEFMGEMSWGIVQTTRGPLLLAIGRDITARRATEARLRAVAALGERALAGADATSLAAEAVDLMGALLPVLGAEVRMADGSVLASVGAAAEPGLRVPIGTGDALHLASERDLTDEELSLVRALANTLATALERLRDQARTRHDAVHDPLTGLANRILLHDRLGHAIASSARGKGCAAVLFVDLDHFKQVNDRHGHQVGDRVLAELARRLTGAVRPGDTVARYGGDEFVAVCERVDESAAMMVGVRMLEAVHAPVRTGEVEHRLSASVGIAIGGDDADELLASADAAVYRAKANGRGRVELAERGI